MIFLSSLLLSIASNIETLSVSLSYGIKKIYFPKSSMVLLTIFTSITTVISMYIGKLMLPLFGVKLANIFGAFLLVYIGLSLISEHVKLKKNLAGIDTSYFFESPLQYKTILNNPAIIDTDNSNHIDIKECFNLSVAISINNFLTLFAASITGANISLSAFIYFIISVVFVYLGYYKPNLNIIKYLKNKLYLLSGIILIILGVIEIFI